MNEARVDIPFKHREIRGLEMFRCPAVYINDIQVSTSYDLDSLQCITGETLEDYQCALEASVYAGVPKSRVSINRSKLCIDGITYDVTTPVNVQFNGQTFTLSRDHLKELNGKPLHIRAGKKETYVKVDIIDTRK